MLPIAANQMDPYAQMLLAQNAACLMQLPVQLVQPLATTQITQLLQQQALLLKLAAMGYADLQPTLDAITDWPQRNASPSSAVGSPGLQQLLQLYLTQQQPQQQLAPSSLGYTPESLRLPSPMHAEQLLSRLQQPSSPSCSSMSSGSYIAPISPVHFPAMSDSTTSVLQQQQQVLTTQPQQQWPLANGNNTAAGVQNNLQQLLQLSAGLPVPTSDLLGSYSSGLQYNAPAQQQYSYQCNQPYNAGLTSLATLTSQASNASSLTGGIAFTRQPSCGSTASSSSNATLFSALTAAAAATAEDDTEVVTCSEFCRQEISVALNAAVTALLQTMRGLQYNGENPYPKQSRRFVCGLRETCKALKAGRVKAVLLAPDIQVNRTDRPELRNEVLDSRVTDIMNNCCQPGGLGVPVVFALSRKQIGQVFGTKKRMSAVAVLDVSGVDDLFEMVVQLAVEGRLGWETKH